MVTPSVGYEQERGEALSFSQAKDTMTSVRVNRHDSNKKGAAPARRAGPRGPQRRIVRVGKRALPTPFIESPPGLFDVPGQSEWNGVFSNPDPLPDDGCAYPASSYVWPSLAGNTRALRNVG